MLKALKKIGHYHSALGMRGTIAFIVAKISSTQPVFKTNVPGIRHPVYLRIGTTDASVLKQVLVEKHYDLPYAIAPETIMDAGANIGLSAVFFANKYPGATIIALEPELSNFELLKKNTAEYPQIRPLRGALWKEDKQLNLIDPDTGHHGFQTMEANADNLMRSGMVPAFKLETIMAQMGFKQLDLLKIDIEGAEKEVFENSSSWIGQVGVVMAELHEHLKTGCNRAFADATQEFSKSPSQGETVVRYRKGSIKVGNNFLAK